MTCLVSDLCFIISFLCLTAQLEFGSVGELLLYRLDALDSSVRSVLHLSAVLGMEFDLLDAALAYEEIFGVNIDERFDAITALRESYDVAVEEGIIEESFTGGENNDDEEIIDDENDLCASLGQVNISLTGRKAHPFYADNRRYRFTHDSWKTSILSCMLGERKCDLHEHIAIALERELDSELHGEDDFERQIRIFKHWNSSGNFVKSADIALNIGSQLMLLGLNTQGILLFNDTLAIMKEQVVDDSRESHGGKFCLGIYICNPVIPSKRYI